jgi:hypothetical protein
LGFCRFADACHIFVKSQKAADRVMEKISQFIENKLKLHVNQEKSQVVKSDAVQLLGFTMVMGTIAIAHKALHTAMDKIKTLTTLKYASRDESLSEQLVYKPERTGKVLTHQPLV